MKSCGVDVNAYIWKVTTIELESLQIPLSILWIVLAASILPEHICLGATVKL